MRLTWAEIWLAGQVGLMRAFKALQNGYRDTNGDSGTFYVEHHFLGCCGEIALAKHLNVFWEPKVDVLEAGDVAGFEVRACREVHHCMMMQRKDNGAAPFVNALVLRDALPAVTLRGWIYGHEGKLARYWRQDRPRPTWFVPASAFHSMEDLPPCEETARVARAARGHATAAAT